MNGMPRRRLWIRARIDLVEVLDWRLWRDASFSISSIFGVDSQGCRHIVVVVSVTPVVELIRWDWNGFLSSLLELPLVP